ncbi:MAG: vitamin B12-dependent ribonucleotide reductase, partial [Thermoanaerobaculia bacterium]
MTVRTESTGGEEQGAMLSGGSGDDRAVIAQKKIGLEFDRVFTTPEVHPHDAVEWELRDARISNEKGDVIFEQNDVEVPKAWSQTATNVVVSKYFRGQLGTDGRETSVRQLIDRVANTMTEWGRKDSFFATDKDAESFHAELTHILLHQ